MIPTSSLLDMFNKEHSESISKERQETLQPLIDAIQEKADAKDRIKLNFVCTHNSRRSQFSQVWATVAAKINNIEASCHSSGVEVTAVPQNVLDSLERFGFDYKVEGEGNAKCHITHPEVAIDITLFSKTISHPDNPTQDFIAVMVCDQANEACPFIPGAFKRVPLTFSDPKTYDGTPQAQEMYDARSLQIASELSYVFSNIKA